MDDDPDSTDFWQGLIASWHRQRYAAVLFAVVATFIILYRRRYLSSNKNPVSVSTRPVKLGDGVHTDFSRSDLHCTNDHNRSPETKDTPIYLAASPSPIGQSSRSKPELRRIVGSKTKKQHRIPEAKTYKFQPLIFFSSLTGTTEKYALNFAKDLRASLRDDKAILPPVTHDLSYIDYDEYFIKPPQQVLVAENVRYVYLLLVPTYNIDTVLTTFINHLQETHHDFRIDTASLSDVAGYSVFGFGDREGWKTEAEGFCSQALQVDKWMARLTSRKRAFPIGMGDVKTDVHERLKEWTDGITRALRDLVSHGGLGEGISGSGDAIESGEEDDNVEDQNRPSKAPLPRRKQRKTVLDDLEDIRGPSETPKEPPIPVDFTTFQPPRPAAEEPREMVPASSPTYAALTKQGYTIIGSHSGVKICRWTKSALRGRGSCYKLSFYGIKSHLCMETTPSLSCSNKCVFCWRHGTNPVGTTWRWKVDAPDMIFEGAKEAHLKKIKMMRGVPGVRAERFQEAMRIRHCALSLVGEPIFYPHINEFLRLLHAERISSFLVCNAQHPEQLAALDKVTQLYVSIDASNKESLRKVDRPLHRDFWERFLKCLDILRARRFQMRTVFRLTLVKGFNVEDEAEGYADLVARGLPCFVEVKGVTYCGTSSSAGAGLTMQNVPFYEEVVAFVEALNSALSRRGLAYGIAAEHAHSCCILIASDRFLIDGNWHTLIDYERFFACLETGADFGPEDYIGLPTPEWANFGKGGFDPSDERVHRKGKQRGLISS
ncbi:MAG: hypothetical protein Q9220_002932 [cf. Caloplaca sp. 1 TL-2023]